VVVSMRHHFQLYECSTQRSIVYSYRPVRAMGVGVWIGETAHLHETALYFLLQIFLIIAAIRVKKACS